MKNKLYIILLLTGFMFSYSQSDKEKEIVDIIKVYRKLAEKGNKSPEMVKRIADSYFFIANYVEAAKWYEELFKTRIVVSDPEYYYRYSQSLRSLGKYEQADQYLVRYYQERKEAEPDVNSYLDVIEANSGRYEIENETTLNSKNSEFGTTFLKDAIVFASDVKQEKRKEKHKNSKQPLYTTSIYAAMRGPDGKFSKPFPFLTEITTAYNESTPVFTKDGKTLYITGNNYSKDKKLKKGSGERLKIYRAELINDLWTNLTELPFCGDDYDVAHPALSPDEKTLYFVSDMPGSLGETDIWKVEIYDNGRRFGQPINLGPTVNTIKRESFPFISKNNELYYASNGKLGLGGLDVFVSIITEDGKYEEAVNVGKPINSPMDDFAFFIDTEKRVGYFSSNRKGGKGKDDIYRLTELSVLFDGNLIIGTIIDDASKKPVEFAEVSLYGNEGELLATTLTDEEGKYKFDKKHTPFRSSFRIRAQKEDYSTVEKFVKTPEITKENTVDMTLQLEKIEFVEQTKGKDKYIELKNKVYFDLGKEKYIELKNNIYFDLDAWNIRDDATVELQKILEIMIDHPKIRIDIHAHTDSRHTHKYNQALSQKRAKATRDWLIKNGISSKRLTAKGYGETQLVNHCADDVPCSEEEHQANRRSEFIIVGVGK